MHNHRSESKSSKMPQVHNKHILDGMDGGAMSKSSRYMNAFNFGMQAKKRAAVSFSFMMLCFNPNPRQVTVKGTSGGHKCTIPMPMEAYKNMFQV